MHWYAVTIRYPKVGVQSVAIRARTLGEAMRLAQEQHPKAKVVSARKHKGQLR